IFLVGDKVEIKDDSRVRAIIYAVDGIKVEDNAELEGAIVGDDADIKDDASVTYTPTTGLEITGVCDAGSIVPPGDERLNFKVEVAELTIIDTYQKPDFTRINFTQDFSEPPLVFTLPTTQGNHSAAHRIRNVTADGFDIMTLEPVSEDGPHVAMSLNFLAVERGVHDLPGGRKLIADTIDTKRVQAYADAGGGIGWETVNFGGVFSSAPAVLGQIQSMVNEEEPNIPSRPSKPWLTTAITGVSATGMQIALERSESVSGSVDSNETVAYLAVEPVDRLRFLDGSDQVVEMEVIRTAELLQGWGTCNANRVNFSSPWSKVPVVLATKNTRDGDAGIGDGDGGWLRRCSTSTTDTRLQIDEVRQGNIGDRNRNHSVRERAGVVVFSGNFVTQARDLDHFRLLHDGFGIIGVPETVRVQACRNADCSQLYTGSVTVTFQPVDASTSWSGPGVLGNQVTFTGGERDVTLHRSTPGTFDIGLTSTPSPQNPNRCFIAGSESCSITFAATDLIVSLPDQVAGGQSLGSVSLPTCFVDFQSVSMPIDVVVQYVSPATPGPSVEVNGSALPNDGSATTLNLDFDANCVAPLQVAYVDAGQIALELTFNGTGTLAGVTLSGADTAAFYPAALIVTAAKPAGADLNAASATAGPIHAAGEAFTLQVRAVNAGGAPTPRYQPQADDRLLAYVQRTGPTSGGSEGSLSIAIAGGSVTSSLGAPSGPGDYTAAGIRPTDFEPGEFKNEAAEYSEVGLVTLYLLDSDYFGHTISAAPLAIGRFVPAGFSATPGTVDDRFLLAGCGDPFTYMDEPLRVNVTLTALNADGLTARNYLGDFAKFPSLSYGGSPGFTLGARSTPTGTNLSSRIIGPSATIPGSWTAGAAQMAIDLSIASLAVPDGPYPATELGLTVRDSDGVGMLDLDLDVDGDSTNDFINVGQTEVRRGRLSLGNAHGSELRDLAVPVAMQFFDGPNWGFRVNPDDNCTPITSVDLSDADAADGLAVADTCIVDAVAASGTFACAPGTPGDQYTAVAAAGRYVTSLRAPGAAKTGGLRIRAVAPAYAKFDWFSAGDTDPIGLGTFGIYNRDTEVIYQREVR
ncbi:MAG: DUF6701 domain-containing protein, partial [Sedimenticolaceae bacterium]